jgi:hypothetical protein
MITRTIGNENILKNLKRGDIYHFKKLNVSLILKYNRKIKNNNYDYTYYFTVLMSNQEKIKANACFKFEISWYLCNEYNIFYINKRGEYCRSITFKDGKGTWINTKINSLNRSFKKI